MKYARTELHLHLDGSLNILWAYKKSLERKAIDENMTFQEFYDILFSINLLEHKESLKKFDITCDCLQYYEDLFEATYLLATQLDDMGIYYAEIRFASQQHCKKGLSQLEALQAATDGAAKAMKERKIKIGIINCLMHKGDSAKENDKENRETIRVTKEMLGKGVVGLDLAGYENNCDLNEYAYLFEIARNEGIPYTIHAGEMGNGENVMKALAMKPQRIGHGVNCIQKDEWVKAVIDAGMTLEVCLSSNTKRDRNYAAHPIRQLIEKGVKVTINSDNMMFSNTNNLQEHYILSMLGVGEKELRQCTLNAIDASFADEATKEYLKERIALLDKE